MKKTTGSKKAEVVKAEVVEFETTARQRRFMHTHQITFKKASEDQDIKKAIELLEIQTINELEGFVTKFHFVKYQSTSFKKVEITFELVDFPASKIDMYQQITIIRDPGGFYSSLENKAVNIFRGQTKLNLESWEEDEVVETAKVVLKKMEQTQAEYIAEVQRYNEFTFEASIVNISRKKKDTITIRVDKEILDYFCKQAEFITQGMLAMVLKADSNTF